MYVIQSFNIRSFWKVLFSLTSSRDHGTLSHFCALLGRLPRAKDPCRDVLFTVLKGHYIAAAYEVLGIRSADEMPHNMEEIAEMQQKPLTDQW